MRITLYKDSKIYILAPANVATGGVELLHQLVFKINSVLGFENVFIKYLGEKEGINPTPKDYEKYKIKHIVDVVDSEKNILIVPETYTQELFKFKKIRKVIRWLSVDNYYFSGGVNITYRAINSRIILKLFNSQNYLGYNEELKNFNHRVQCEYVRQHLLRKGIKEENIGYLSDYLIADFFENKRNVEDKKNIVCYNPKKGFKYTKKLIKYMEKDEVDFIPIQNMNRQQVIDLLKKSKVYIDFGHFPGKDRIPREAATLGDIIIISKMGAGGFYEDFPIDEKYKVKGLSDVKLIRDKILLFIKNYDELIKEFGDYIKLIKNDEKVFDNDLKHIFNNDK